MESANRDAFLQRAMNPPRVYGRGVLAAQSRAWAPYVLITMPVPWTQAQPMLSAQPAHVAMVSSMERRLADAFVESLPRDLRVVGLGGGMAMDMAKYAAWARGQEPVLVPSIASVDACFTNSVALREAGRVRYVGSGTAQLVVVDYALVSGAPPALNRAGIGDILSIHTACWDWRLAAQHGEVPYDEPIAQAARALVEELTVLAPEIRAVSDRALHWLFEAYVAENALCLRVGHSRPEEGSEHFVAYCVEHFTGRSFVHGELVCLGILLMSRLQGNRPEWVQDLLEATGVRYQPADLGLTREEVALALERLPAYVAEEGLAYSIIQERGMAPEQVSVLLHSLRFAS